MILTYEAVAKRIDHSLLGPALSDEELDAGCRLAAEYAVASVCIKPHAVPRAVSILHGGGVAVGTTIGFPHGGHATAVKLFEAAHALDDGATELDMVINIGQAIAGDWGPIEQEIAAITRQAHDRGAIVKVIFENCFLNNDQKARLCAICGAVGADYVKTSTGYGTGGATLDDLRLMRRFALPPVKLKAAGGVRTLEAVGEVIAVGCERIGLSKTQDILDDLKGRLARGERIEIAVASAPERSALGGGY